MVKATISASFKAHDPRHNNLGVSHENLLYVAHDGDWKKAGLFIQIKTKTGHTASVCLTPQETLALANLLASLPLHDEGTP